MFGHVQCDNMHAGELEMHVRMMAPCIIVFDFCFPSSFDLASSWTWSKELISESVELSNYNLTARATCSGVGVAKANVIAEAEFDSDFQLSVGFSVGSNKN